MKTFKKFLESYEPVNEAEYNKEWWDSKSDSFKKRYIERHPNSIYAQKAGSSKPSGKERTPEHIDKEIAAITSTLGSLMKEPGGARDDVIEGLISKISELQREKAAKIQNEKKPSTADDSPAMRAAKAANDRMNHLKLAIGDKVNGVKPSTSIKATKDLVQNKNSASSDFEKAATVLLDKPKNEEPWMRKVIALAEHPYTPESVIRRMEKEQPFAALHSPKASQEFLDAQAKSLDPMRDYTWIDVLVQNPSLDTSQRETMAKKLKKAIKDVDKLDVDDEGSPIIDSQKDYMKERFQWQLDQLTKK